MVSISSTNRRNRNKSVEQFTQNFLPPIIGIFSFLILWQICSMTGLIKLPPPSSLWTDERTRIYLMYPFFDRGGTDVGLFWQAMASLQRVLIGYSLAAFVGIGVGIMIGLNSFWNKAFPRNWVEILERVCRVGVFSTAARELGIEVNYQRQPIALFDGVEFNAEDPISYLMNSKIHRNFTMAEVHLDGQRLVAA